MDQQFRLKWNNHCNTLLQVFGNLLKTETLVDCTIGADGQYLKAHKVVVSACSPYFQSLFTEHFDKHPIIILKDIKFAELQSMIDYMYEGEVNISQDQLPSFLKAAASIQLKGLTQNVKSEAPPPPQSPPSSKPPLPQLNSARGGMLSNGSLTPSSMLNVELEEGQQRKKRKLGATGTEPSSASSSPSLVPDLVTPSVILDVPGENTGAGATVGQNGQGGGGGQSGDGGLMKKEPSEYSGRSEDEEEDGMSHDGWDLSNDGLHDSNSTMSAGDRTGQGPGGLHHNTPAGGMRPAGGPGGLSAAGGPDMSNVDENNQGSIRSARRKPKKPHHNLPSILEPKRTNLSSGIEECKRTSPTINQPTDRREPNNVKVVFNKEPARTHKKTNPWLEEYISKFPCFKQEPDPVELQTSLRKSHEQFTSHGDVLPKQDQNRVQSIPLQNKVKDEYIFREDISNDNFVPDMYGVKMEDVSNNNDPLEFSKGSNTFLSSTTDLSNSSAHFDAGKAIDKSGMSAIVDMLHNLSPNMKTEIRNKEKDIKGHEDVTAFATNEIMSAFHRDLSLDQSNHKSTRVPMQGYVHGQSSFTSSKVLQARDGFKVHIPGKSGMTETGKSAFKCDRCGNAYARMHSLSRHVKFECGVAPKFECYICHKRSKHKHNLLLHMKTHAPHK